MAHGTIPLGQVTLQDNWPGPVDIHAGMPANGWNNTVDNFKTTSRSDSPRWPVGTKIQAYHDSTLNPGWYTMMYLQYCTFEDSDISIGDYSGNAAICCHADNSTPENYNVDYSAVPYYVVSPDITETDANTTNLGRVAFPCATLDSDGTASNYNDGDGQGYGDSYGWFWVGGVCPVKDATILDGTAGDGIGAAVSCGSMVESGAFVFCFSTTSIYIERPDFSASFNTDPSAGPSQAPYAGYLDTSHATSP